MSLRLPFQQQLSPTSQPLMPQSPQFSPADEATPLWPNANKTNPALKQPKHFPGRLAELRTRTVLNPKIKSWAEEIRGNTTTMFSFGEVSRRGANKSPVCDIPRPLTSKPTQAFERHSKAEKNNNKRSKKVAEQTAANVEDVLSKMSEDLPKSHQDAANPDSMFEAVKLIRQLFPNAENEDLENLQSALHSMPIKAGADRTTIAYALAAASGGDMRLAARTLLKMARGFRLDAEPPTAQQTQPDIEKCAWKFAQFLAETEQGFALFKQMHKFHALFDRAERVILQVGVASAEHKLTEEAFDFNVRVRNAAYKMRQPGTTLIDSEKAAIFAWEQGFRNDGEGTPLRAIQERLEKFVYKTIPRVEVSRRRSFLARLCGKQKSPLSILQDGVHGANRPPLKTEQENVARFFGDAATALADHVSQNRLAITSSKKPFRALASTAILRHFSTLPDLYPGKRIDFSAAPAIIEEMDRILQTLKSEEDQPAAQLAELEMQVEKLRKNPDQLFRSSAIKNLVVQPLTTERLGMWAKETGVENGEQFWHIISEVNHIIRPSRTTKSPNCKASDKAGNESEPKVDNKSSCESVRNDVENLIDSMYSSSRLHLSEGRHWGFSTKGLSLIVSTLLGFVGVPLAARLNIGSRSSRRSTVEIARSSYGGEIIIGAETQRCRTRGVGAMLGYDVLLAAARLRLGISLDVEKKTEKRHLKGIVLRVAQHHDGEGKADSGRLKQGMKELTNFMFDQQKMPEKLSCDALFDQFSAHFFDNPDVSIGFTEPKEKRKSKGVTLAFKAMFKLSGTPVSIGPGAEVSLTKKSIEQLHPGDVGGRLQTKRSARRGDETELGFAAGLRSKFSNNSTNSAGNPHSVASFLGASLPCWSLALPLSGQRARARLMQREGKIQYLSSTLDIEFQKFEDYADSLTNDQDYWLKYLVQQHGKEVAVSMLENHLTNARYYARSNQTFTQRRHLCKAAARTIDRHKMSIDLISASDHLPRELREKLCQDLEIACAKLVSNKESWEPLELKIIEKCKSRSVLGFMVGIQAGVEKISEGEHQLDVLKLQKPLSRAA